MQQFPFIDLFESALHVPGDKLAHLQEHFLTVHTALVQYNAPMLLPTGNTGQQQCRCIVPKLYIQSKRAPEDGRVCRPKHVQQS